ncbi:hypothetical protein PR048_032782 [Dryococelus australis]|uniref:Uncharacterized protein n=1 Tax=Dryococelus australis TaxID=614101 RepID=A0ABQ9G359_9NEOP|nr:hypothetical protein PR048_032782 [Dryococelus australis]
MASRQRASSGHFGWTPLPVSEEATPRPLHPRIKPTGPSLNDTTVVWSTTGMQGRGKREIAGKNPPTSGIVRHDSNVRKSGSDLPRIKPSSPRWEAGSLSTTPPKVSSRGPQTSTSQGAGAIRSTLLYASSALSTLRSRLCNELTRGDSVVLRALARIQAARLLHTSEYRELNAKFGQGATVAERLARSPPTKANRVQNPAGSPDFSRRVFSGISRFPPPLHSGAAPYSLNNPHRISRPLAVKSRPNFFTRSLAPDVNIRLKCMYHFHPKVTIKVVYASLNSTEKHRAKLEFTDYGRNAARATGNVGPASLRAFQGNHNKPLADSSSGAQRGPIRSNYVNSEAWWGEESGPGH